MHNTSVPLNSRDALVAVLLTLLVLVTGGYQMVQGVCGVYHDDAIYVSTAQALAEGEGYRLINLPGSPPQTKYPILYPALLSVVWKLWPSFPDNLLAMQWLTLLAGAATVGLSYLYLVRFGYCSRSVAAASGLLCATAPVFLYFGTQTLSEMPFALLLVLAVWGLDGYIRGPSKNRSRQLGLGVLLALPFLCRTIGVILIPAGLVIMYRAGRPVRWLVLGSVMVMLPWVLWALTGWGTWHQDPIVGYYADYLGWWSESGILLLPRVLIFNGLVLAGSSVSLGLAGFNEAVSSLKLPAWPIPLLLLGLLPWLIMFSQLRQHRALPWCLVAYLLLILVWPWPPTRFLIPILPFLVSYLLLSISTALRRVLPLSGYRVLIMAGIVVVVIANLWLLSRLNQVSQRFSYPYTSVASVPEAPVSWSSYEDVFAWLRTHSRPDDVIASGLDSMTYLYTGRRAFRPFVGRPAAMFYGQDSPATGTVKELEHFLKVSRARYLMHVPMLGFSEEKPFTDLLDALRIKHPGWLTPVYVGEDQRFVIFESRSHKEPASK
jgi:hypothetical protein